jgi:hypothetical protein
LIAGVAIEQQHFCMPTKTVQVVVRPEWKELVGKESL